MPSALSPHPKQETVLRTGYLRGPWGGLARREPFEEGFKISRGEKGGPGGTGAEVSMGGSGSVFGPNYIPPSQGGGSDPGPPPPSGNRLARTPSAHLSSEGGLGARVLAPRSRYRLCQSRWVPGLLPLERSR